MTTALLITLAVIIALIFVTLGCCWLQLRIEAQQASRPDPHATEYGDYPHAPGR